jgi:hypothetical protein
MNINPALDPQNEDPAAFTGMHCFQPNKGEALFPAPDFQPKNSLLNERLSRNKEQPAIAMNPDRIFAKQLVILLVLGGTLAICSLSKKKELPLVASQNAKLEPAKIDKPSPENILVATTTPETAKNWSPPGPEENAARAMRKQWAKFITAKHSSYGYGVLGGINNLSVLFSNQTNYPLEEVRVRISIIKANGETWKKQELSVYNLMPHTEASQMVPRMKRGKAVQVKIIKVKSSKMQLNYEINKPGLNASDPYLLK